MNLLININVFIFLCHLHFKSYRYLICMLNFIHFGNYIYTYVYIIRIYTVTNAIYYLPIYYVVNKVCSSETTKIDFYFFNFVLELKRYLTTYYSLLCFCVKKCRKIEKRLKMSTAHSGRLCYDVYYKDVHNTQRPMQYNRKTHFSIFHNIDINGKRPKKY